MFFLSPDGKPIMKFIVTSWTTGNIIDVDNSDYLLSDNFEKGGGSGGGGSGDPGHGCLVTLILLGIMLLLSFFRAL